MTATRELRCELDWAGPVDLPLADESTVQAACGIMHVHGRARGRPEPLAVDYATSVATVLARQGALAGLVARERGLTVTSVRTSVAQAALLAVGQYLADAATGEAPPGGGPGGPPFRSADGVHFEIETLAAEDWHRFWRRLGTPEQAIRAGWPAFQRRFATAVCPLPAELGERLAAVTLPVVAAVGGDTGVSVLPVRADPPRPAGRPWRLDPLGPATGHVPGRAYGRPLDGLTVVESTRRVQGPLAGHVLRMLGADVVRVEPPGGEPMRGVPPLAGDCSARFLALNAGKRAVELDLRHPAGRAELAALVAEADVFLHNWAPGKAQEWGLAAADLARVRPGLVYAAASGWGDEFGAHPPLGTDYLVQAHSGLAAAIRPAGEPPAPSLMTLTDVLGGLVCAEGVLAALLGRLRSGQGATVHSSLLSATAALNRPPVRPEWTFLSRPLRTEDGYLALGSAARQQPGLVTATLGASTRNRPTAHWLARLADAGLPAAEVCTDLAALAADPRFAGAVSWSGHAAVLPPWEFA